MPDHATLWVCTECYFAYHNGDYTKPDEAHCQPWAKYDLADGTPTMTSRGISSGLMASEHPVDCAFHTSKGEEPCTWDGECEHQTFSTSRCDTCDCHLAGDRFAMTVIYQESTS